MMNGTIKPIRADKDYRNALKRIESLMEAEGGTPEADELDVLSALVERYEEQHFPMDLPDPIEAIRFRMEQLDLSQRDLIPFIGSRAKVSEVLAGKRTLTLQMIRELHEHLGIPAEVLLHQTETSLPETSKDINWSKFPLVAMANHGWIEKTCDLKGQAEEIMRNLIEKAGGLDTLPALLYRKNNEVRQNAKMDIYALQAWCYQLLAKVRETPLPTTYQEGSITEEFVRSLVQLSWSKEGPKLAKEYLAEKGIHLIYLPHLPRTHLDGAALKLSDGTPVIGLTLRYDRIDNFWFCLYHELAHLKLHIEQGKDDAFFDDITLAEVEAVARDDKEVEADNWAEEMLIPSAVWNSSSVKTQPTPIAVVELAHELKIHPAIIAGRLRKLLRNYRILSHYVGSGEVRKYFEELPV